MVLKYTEGDKGMKKFCIWYFIPAIVFVSILLYFGGAEAFVQPSVLVNLSALILFGIIMQKGSIWGASLGIVYGAGWIIRDLFRSTDIPSAILCVPLIIYYIYCVIAIKTVPKDE